MWGTGNKASLIFSIVTRWKWVAKFTVIPLPSNQQHPHSTMSLLTHPMVQSPSWEANRFAASQEIPPFHGTRRFITALTSVRHLSLSWASPTQSIYPHSTSLRFIIILSTHLRLGLPSRLFPSGFPTKNLYTPSPHPYAPHAQPISFFSILSPAQYWVRSTNH